MTHIQEAFNTSVYVPPIATFPAPIIGQDSRFPFLSAGSNCHGRLWYDAVLVVSSIVFLVYLAVHSKKNLKKLCNGGSSIMICYYALLWVVSLLNLVWCFFQVWQCTPGKEVAWNILSLFTASGMLCLEVSLVAFLLQQNYTSSVESLTRTFVVSGIIFGVDILLKAIYVFGFGVPLFINGTGSASANRVKWGLLIVHKLLITAAYGFILFVHFPKWREKLPPRPAFYNYIVIMFAISSVALFAYGLAGVRVVAGFGIWMFNLTLLCYHSLYLPFLYTTFLADFFQEDNYLLDSAYYDEMKDA
ncbi:hypothetical protein UlMin_008382 [Ulmus minor]